MAVSKLEEQLANDLMLMSRRESKPWPEPVAQFHPFWCCEHKKHKHVTPPKVYRAFCQECDATSGWPVYPFHDYDKPRDFSLDFAWPLKRFAVEVEGVVWSSSAGGRHQRAAGFTRDLEKHAALDFAGWKVIRVGAQQIKDGTALALIEKALGVEQVGEN